MKNMSSVNSLTKENQIFFDKIKEEKDWLGASNIERKLLRRVISSLQNISDNLKYSLPHIAEDIGFDIGELKFVETLSELVANKVIDDGIHNHNEFVGSMFSALLQNTDEPIKEES